MRIMDGYKAVADWPRQPETRVKALITLRQEWYQIQPLVRMGMIQSSTLRETLCPHHFSVTN